MKVCTKCGVEKSAAEFYKAKNKRDGLRNNCKSCHDVNVKSWQKRNKKKYYAIIEQWRRANPEKSLARNQRWRKMNYGRCSVNDRKSKLGNATPKWLTSNHLTQMAEWYKIAKELQWLSNERLEVDHIIPLNSEIVCGLNVPWNLQILTRSENRKKHNKLIEAA